MDQAEIELLKAKIAIPDDPRLKPVEGELARKRQAIVHAVADKIRAAARVPKAVTLSGHKSGVCSAAFSPEGKHLASANADKTVKIWDDLHWTKSSK